MKKSVVAFVCCIAAGVTLADFQVGFARVDMTPQVCQLVLPQNPSWPRVYGLFRMFAP